MHKLKVTKRQRKAEGRNLMCQEILDGFHMIGNAEKKTEQMLKSSPIQVGTRMYMGLRSERTLLPNGKVIKSAGVPFVRMSI